MRMENAVSALNKVSRYCSSRNMRLILENMLPHLLFGQMSDLLWILGGVDQRNVGICLDTGHAYLSGDLDSVLFKLSGHLKMIHAADNKGKHDDHLAPGEGSVNWPKFIASLMEVKFSGTIILELSGERGKSVKELLREALQARHFLWSLAREIDSTRPI